MFFFSVANSSLSDFPCNSLTCCSFRRRSAACGGARRLNLNKCQGESAILRGAQCFKDETRAWCANFLDFRLGVRGGAGDGLKKAAHFHEFQGRLSTKKEHVSQPNKVLHGFEPRSLDSESRVLTVTPRDQHILPRQSCD